MRKSNLAEPLLAGEKNESAKAASGDANSGEVQQRKNGKGYTHLEGSYGYSSRELTERDGVCCYWCGCAPRCSGNIKTLCTVIILFSTISIAQLLGSFIANSLALLGDSISMGIDTLTFMGNLYGECSVSRHRVTIQLVASGISLLALFLATISVIIEAVDRLMYSDKYIVDPYIVLGFSFVGLCFDVICFVAYYKWGSDPFDPSTMIPKSSPKSIANKNGPAETESGGTSRQDANTEMEPVVSFGANHADLEAALVDSQIARINMCSALMHVGSDALRSITTLIEGLLILYTDLDSENTDAVASLIVSTIIVFGAVGALIQWGHQCAKHYRGELISRSPTDISKHFSSSQMEPGGEEVKKEIKKEAPDSTGYKALER
eukprot:CAMPEP_0114509232 /NCGR_PEP_ID=MMETSP0109-20121206/13086_1 /TAXON_ID=29199 /ORGANISM="Chlorarachnion reptans, Strain CCCM449" /LENGTH=377 /DNA_ID=CAMNT_0001688343 /DNA_START=212 /DNA_END=1345 /DNA_ORIENTATION=-